MAEYIDRGKFKESAEDRYCKPCKADGKDYNGCRCLACWVDDMIDKVDCFQPADVAPVRHGRWLYVDTDTEQFFLCNRCKKKEYWESNYCPACGAKMDGGGGDG